MSNEVEAKQKILNAAEKIFAEKGYDGARVNEIAKAAGVNKALIYYYFNSKEDILVSLFSSLIDEVTGMFKGYSAEELESLFAGENSGENFDGFVENILDYVLAKKDILKVAMIESIKSGTKDSIIIKTGEIILDPEIKAISHYKKMGDEFLKQLLVTEFFTAFIPIINYIIFEDSFSDYFEINKENLRGYFINAFKQTHLVYHKQRSTEVDL